jgi:hypothetical protein
MEEKGEDEKKNYTGLFLNCLVILPHAQMGELRLQMESWAVV